MKRLAFLAVLVALPAAAQQKTVDKRLREIESGEVRITVPGSSTGRALRDHLATLPDVDWSAVYVTTAKVRATGPLASHEFSAAAWMAKLLELSPVSATDPVLLSTASCSTMNSNATRTASTYRTQTNGRYWDGTTVGTCASSTLRQSRDLTYGNPGILVEPARTNLAYRSEEFDNGSWGKATSGIAAPVVTANAYTDPWGTGSTADQVDFAQVTAANQQGFLYMGLGTGTAGQTRTCDVWARTVSGTGTLRYTISENGGAAGSSGSTAVDTTWRRVTPLTRTLTTSTATYFEIGPDSRAALGQPSTQAALSVYLDAANCTTLGAAASYVGPVVGSPVTVGADPLGIAAKWKYVPGIPNIIVDDDSGEDADGAGEVAMLHRAADLGYCNILATVVNGTSACRIATMNAINTYYGRGDLPLGVAVSWPGSAADGTWCSTVANSYSNSTAHAVPSTTLVRMILADPAIPNGGVRYFATGQMRNLKDLYDSPADAISPLTGAELIAQKFGDMVVVAGDYPSGNEYNFTSDADAAAVLNSLRTIPTVFLGYTDGYNMVTGQTLNGQESYNPVAYAFSSVAFARRSWGPLGSLFAVWGPSYLGSAYFTFGPDGVNSISASTGDNEWLSGAATGQRYVTLSGDPAGVATTINTLLAASPRTWANAGDWCRWFSGTPSGAWTTSRGLWSRGLAKDYAKVEVTGGNLTFTVVDAAGGTKTATYAASNLAAGRHRVGACVASGALQLYVDGVAVGSSSGSGTGLLTSRPAAVVVGGPQGSEFNGVVDDFRECSTGAPTADCQ